MKCSNVIVPGFEETSKIKNTGLETKIEYGFTKSFVTVDRDKDKESASNIQGLLNYISKARGTDGVNKTRQMLFEKAVIEKDNDELFTKGSFVFVSPKKGTQTGSELNTTMYGLSAVDDADFSIETVRHRIGVNDEAMMVKRIYVDPAYRRIGIAVDLYLAAIEDARSRGLDLVSDYDVRPEAVVVYGKLAQLAEEKDLGFTVAMNTAAKTPWRKPGTITLADYYRSTDEPVMRILIDKKTP